MLARTCPFSPHADNEDTLSQSLFPDCSERHPNVGRYAAAFVGHVEEGAFRSSGSSGGLVSWIAAELLSRQWVDGVAHVVPCDPDSGRLFEYRISRTVEAVGQGAKSRYYPIELSQVVREIRNVPGRYAVVGIPCFLKAVHLLRKQDPVLAERIVCTIGLFCGHMKSSRMAESFAWQMGQRIGNVSAIDYRLKDPSRPANWYRASLDLKHGGNAAQDWWHLADGDWGAGFFQNSACNFCDDVVAETADVSVGDAWLEPYSSDGRGTNVIVVRSPEMLRLIEDGAEQSRVSLEPVDGEFVHRTQEAGFRHRREGLSYRLAHRRRHLSPRKRVSDHAPTLSLRRKLVYRLRAHIARWSHRMFYLARALHWPRFYLGWARSIASLYGGLVYSRGRAGAFFDRCEHILKRFGLAAKPSL